MPLSDRQVPSSHQEHGKDKVPGPWDTGGTAVCTGQKRTEDNILGFRKWPLNQFSHDIILPGSGTVTLGGSRTLAKGMFPDVMLSNRTRPERQAGTGLHQGKLWVKTQHSVPASPWQGTATGFPVAQVHPNTVPQKESHQRPGP